jgi:hypothetical protein
VAGDRALDRLGEVMEQVPPLGDLDGEWRASGRALRVAAPRSRQITSTLGRLPSQDSKDSADLSGSMSTGRRVSMSTSTVP